MLVHIVILLLLLVLFLQRFCFTTAVKTPHPKRATTTTTTKRTQKNSAGRETASETDVISLAVVCGVDALALLVVLGEGAKGPLWTVLLLGQGFCSKPTLNRGPCVQPPLEPELLLWFQVPGTAASTRISCPPVPTCNCR